MPCVLVQNKIDLVDENIVKNDKKFIDFANKNNFIKCFRTSVKKNINIDKTMDFLIEYIITKLDEINIKNLDKTEEKHQQIILTSESFEVTKEINDLQFGNCCSDMSLMKLQDKNINKNNRDSDNSNSTIGNSYEEKKEI